MAREIPTFTSDRTTQIPSMGIINAGGQKAMGEAVGNRAALFDQIGAFANKKADEAMAREMKEAAETAVRSGGLDPATLKDPFTTADKIYREAALNTYSIGVEDTLNNRLNELQLKNRDNPQGFRAAARGAIEGTVAKLPPELKNGMDQAAKARETSIFASMSADMQRRLLAENAAVEKAKLTDLAAQIVNSKVEDREVLMAKASAIIGGSTHTLTGEAKRAEMVEFEKKVIQAAVMTDNMNGQMTPVEAVAALKEAGIAVTPDVQSQVYSTSFIHQAYQEKLKAQRDAEKANLRDALVESAYSEVLANPAASDLDFMRIADQKAKELAAADVAPSDVIKFKTTFLSQARGMTTDSPEALEFINMMIENNDPAVIPAIKEYVNLGALKLTTASGLENQARVAGSEFAKSAAWTEFQNTDLRSRYPMAFLDAQQFAGDPSMLRRIANDKGRVQSLINEGIQMSSNPEKPMSFDDVVAQMRGKVTQLPGRQISNLDLPAVTPSGINQDRFLAEITSEAPPVRLFIPENPKATKIIPLTGNDKDTVPPRYQMLIEEFGSGPWTRENAERRLQVMQKSNNLYYTHNKDGKSPPYSKQELKYYNDTFGLGYTDFR